MNAIIAFTEKEIKDNPFIDAEGGAAFYRKVVDVACKPIGKTYDDISSLDCTRILISPDIQESWFDTLTKQGHSRESIVMTLANWGPKTDDSLAEHTVKLQPKALTFEGDIYFPAE